ncbi:16S rRNA (adenine(1518)-N(6)/adenine(1519)-N(6))-dimethyltransferase RsmA [Spiroplasma endosymbiont of Crioceris asparagi]|uniref:16S rRNA (adenine(1518)-N(6)/adenine(1519)-N(6))- dimethyltransferase RsmA n=1 Tax=Spiroplasma endosymbiont of Crioceris asparagi TaxID=3066286 RepID=UPI0030D16C98
MKAKKHFGQNFISDDNLIKKIIDCLGESKQVVEIGPGRGALTKELVNRYNNVLAIEIDKDLEKHLVETIKSDNLKIIIGDFLDLNIDDLCLDDASVISNIPYYVTSPILFRIFENKKYFKKAVFMVQKEVANRICAKPGNKEYGSLTVAANYFADVKFEFNVNKKFFNPQPKVDSAVISFTFLNNFIDIDEKSFLSFVKKMFANKRKNILNNLSNITQNKETAKNILTDLNIGTNFRSEDLNLDSFISIFKKL